MLCSLRASTINPNPCGVESLLGAGPALKVWNRRRPQAAEAQKKVKQMAEAVGAVAEAQRQLNEAQVRPAGLTLWAHECGTRTHSL